MDNPDCLQVGSACRYADASGTVRDAIITEIISTFDLIVNLSYDNGKQTVNNVAHSANPAAHRWGCASEGAPRQWGDADAL